MSQENVEIVQRFYEAFGEGDLDAATAVFAADVKMTDPDLGTVEGLPAFRDYLEGLKGPLPDAGAIVERILRGRRYRDRRGSVHRHQHRAA